MLTFATDVATHLTKQDTAFASTAHTAQTSTFAAPSTVMRVTSSQSVSNSAVQHVALGSGLFATIPNGSGRASVRWHQAAQAIVDRLRFFYAERGTALEYREAEELTSGGVMRWMEIRVVDDELPADCLLSHPIVAKVLLESLEILMGTQPAVFYSEGRLRACPAAEAQQVAGWTGPMDLSAGYCMTLALK